MPLFSSRGKIRHSPASSTRDELSLPTLRALSEDVFFVPGEKEIITEVGFELTESTLLVAALEGVTTEASERPACGDKTLTPNDDGGETRENIRLVLRDIINILLAIRQQCTA